MIDNNQQFLDLEAVKDLGKRYDSGEIDTDAYIKERGVLSRLYHAGKLSDSENMSSITKAKLHLSVEKKLAALFGDKPTVIGKPQSAQPAQPAQSKQWQDKYIEAGKQRASTITARNTGDNQRTDSSGDWRDKWIEAGKQKAREITP